MPLTTRVLNNTGAPLVDSSGTILAGTTITFQLVDLYDHPTDAWDAISGERIVPIKESVVTDASGLFTISLWPNDRGTESTMYLCTVKAKNVQTFKGAIATSASALSWIDFFAQGVPLTPAQLDQLALLNGLTASAAELNTMDGITSTTAELNILHGVTATTTELNYVDGVTSNIQTQLGTKPLSSRTGGGGLTSWLQNNLTNNTISNFDPDGGSYLYMDVSSVYLKNNYTQGSASSQVLLDSSATTISGPSIIIQPTTTTRMGTTTNNTTFEADGSMVMYGNATTWRDINISLVPPAGQASALPAIIAVNADPYLSCYAFSGTNSTPDQISGSLEIDHSYKEGSDISFHVHWAPTTTAIGNVVWQLRYAWFNRDTTPVGATLQTNLVATTSGVAWQEQTASFTLTGTGKTMGSRLIFTLFRDPINAGDTYAANAATYDMGLHFESDTLGSREMLVK